MTEVDKRSDVDNKVLFWRKEIGLADKRERKWREERAKEALRLYRDERPEEQDNIKKKRRFNIFWSTIEVLKPAVLGRSPAPNVRRRFIHDDNDTARQAADILERSLSFAIDDPATHYIETIEAARDDMLIPGRGVTRERYEAEFQRRTPETQNVMGVDEVSGEEVILRQEFLLDGQPIEPEFEGDEPFVEEKVSESVNTEYVYWEDYREGATRSWPPPWVAYKHRMSRSTLVEEFGDVGKEVSLTATIDGETKKVPKDSFKRAIVWEIWDMDTLKPRTRLWIADGFDKALLEEDDPLELEGFYPQPEPIYAVRTTDSRIPIPEVAQYIDQINELNNVTTRIYKLVDVLKARGLYDSALQQVPDLQHMEDGEFQAVEHAKSLQDKGGLENSIWMWPIDKIVLVIRELMVHREAVKQEVFELTGISDIIRGSTKASETFGAQRLKAQFGSLRVQPRQVPMQRFIRNGLRIKAEIMAEQFDKETFERMTGQEVPDEVMELLGQDRLRAFNVDIETDSTVAGDQEAEKQQSIEFTGAVTQYLTAAVQIGGIAPQTIPLMMEMLKFATKPFKIGRSLEETIDQTAEQLKQQAEQAQQQPQTDPAQQEAERQAQTEQQKFELEDRKLKVAASTQAAQIDQKDKDRQLAAVVELNRGQG